MENKKISLRAWMFIKIIPAVLLLAYYYMSVRTTYTSFDRFLPNVIGAFLGALFIVIFKKEQEIEDERARESKNLVDALCLKISLGLFTVIIFVLAVGSFSSIIIGYFIAIAILIITMIRAIAFYIVDKKGV